MIVICRNIVLFLFIVCPLYIFAQPPEQKMTRQEYIEKYKDWAIIEQQRVGIPASITLAQGILESNDGNSELARVANNHFGIKCHAGWNGKTFHMDDDAKNECFRNYSSVYDSYKDHSEFLTTRKRYAFLFEYDQKDYEKWANGLKEAGYATNPKYPQLLIKLIEENQLHQYDQAALLADNKKDNTKESPQDDTKDKPVRNKRNRNKKLADPDNYSISLGGRKVELNNGIKYITVKAGDSFFRLSEELDMLPVELYKYNDLNKGSELIAGQKIYIQPKRSKAEPGKNEHIVKKGETMYSISQDYGIKLRQLYKRNNMKAGTPIAEGTKIWLRSRKPM